MTNSKQIAGLIGPTLIALSISEGINLRTLATSNAAVFALLIVLFALGVFLTFKAYSREDSKTAV
jgi:hypothetical protein